MQSRKAVKMFVVVLGLFFCFASMAWSQAVVKMNCPGPNFSPSKVVIKPGDAVQFQLGNCTNVTINGGAPIGTINLNGGNPSQTVTFPNAGTFTASATGSSGEGSATSITIEVRGSVPSLTTYGLIVLALLLTGTAIWLFRKRLVMEKGGLA